MENLDDLFANRYEEFNLFKLIIWMESANGQNNLEQVFYLKILLERCE